MIGRGAEVDSKEVAIEERVLVVATGRPHAVGAGGGRVKGTAREVANRRDIEPVELACWQARQENIQPGDFNFEFAQINSANNLSNYRRCRGAAGDQRAACVKQGSAASNFPRRTGNGDVKEKIMGEDFGYIPPLGHVEIVIYTGELAGAERGVPLVSQAVDAIIVAVIPKRARR